MRTHRRRRDRDRPHVALFVETSINYGRGVLRGIARYLRECGPWSIFLEQHEIGAKLPDWIDRWDGDGIITRYDHPQILETELPTVVLFDRTDEWLGLPRILNDNLAVGRMAAKHLLERGFESFGYYGIPSEYWSDLRWRGVQEMVKVVEGVPCHCRHDPGDRTQDWELQQNALAEWISSLPRPLGLIACNDIHGLRALDACRRAQLAVPEEVAVVGADNDVELCDLSDPPLSSIDFNRERVGYEAAALLDCLMMGETPSSLAQLIPPLGVITRQSTEILAIADPYVAQALHIIRRRACSGIDVQSVLERLPLCRRSLEQRFRQFLGRSPGAEIQRVRIEQAKMLLAETDLTIEVVSRKSGFSKPAYFSTAFKNQTGIAPSMYRRLADPRGSPSADVSAEVVTPL
jgi:LacI family transcriptional regulator, galactose operon repressor